MWLSVFKCFMFSYVVVDENACGSNPCQNGATCVDTMGGYTCGPCPAAVTGYNCERRMFMLIIIFYTHDFQACSQPAKKTLHCWT